MTLYSVEKKYFPVNGECVFGHGALHFHRAGSAFPQGCLAPVARACWKVSGSFVCSFITKPNSFPSKTPSSPC